MKPLQSLARAATWWKSIRAVRLRPHRSTLVFLLPVLAILVLANWPGWPVVYVDPINPSRNVNDSCYERYEHGWPFTYLRRKLVMSSSLWTWVMTSSPRILHDGYFSFLKLACDAAVAIAILMAAGVLIEARRRRLQSCFQFHLWELLALVTLVAIAMSAYTVRRNEYYRELRISEELEEPEWMSHVTGIYAYQVSSGPVWLLPVLGQQLYRELFQRLLVADINGNDLQRATELRHLRILSVDQPSLDQLKLLTQMPQLEAIEFTGPWQGPDSTGRTIEMPPLPRLLALEFSEPDFLIDQIQKLRGLGPGSKLDPLVLPRPRVDNAALVSIGRIKTLVYLGLDNANVSDAGLPSLANLHNLRRLDLSRTRVTADGVRRLQAALPDCKIEWSPPKPDK